MLPTHDATKRSPCEQPASPLFLFASFGIIFMGLCASVSSLLLLCNVSVSAANPLLAFALTLAILRFVCDIPNQKILLTTLIWGAMFLMGLFAIGHISDLSWDANVYHQMAVGALCDGWNPIYTDIMDFAHASPLFQNTPDDLIFADWLNHFPSGAWYIGACFYTVSHLIESAKAMNLFYLLCLGSLSVWFFKTHFFRSKLISLGLALVVTCNPIAIMQLFSLYFDGLFGTIFSLIAILLLMLFFKERYSNSLKKLLFVNLLMCVSVGCNLKFTTLCAFAVLCFASFIVYLCKLRAQKAPFSAYRSITLFWVISVVNLFLVGASSYVKNTVLYLHPFYPLYQWNGTAPDIMGPFQPEIFAHYSPLRKFLLCLFSPTNLQDRQQDVVLKLPFTFDPAELWIRTLDVYRGGFGLFFSGLFLVSLVIIGLACFAYCKKKEQNWAFIFLLTLVGVIVLLVCVIDASWLSRYSPFFYLFVPIALFLSLSYIQANKKYWLCAPLALCLGLLMINNATFLRVPGWIAAQSTITHAIFAEMQSADLVQISTEHNFAGTLYQLWEHDIPYEFVTELEDPDGFVQGYAYKLYFAV